MRYEQATHTANDELSGDLIKSLASRNPEIDTYDDYCRYESIVNVNLRVLLFIADQSQVCRSSLIIEAGTQAWEDVGAEPSDILPGPLARAGERHRQKPRCGSARRRGLVAMFMLARLTPLPPSDRRVLGHIANHRNATPNPKGHTMATVFREFLPGVWLGCRILVPAIVVLLLLQALQ
jgi:hypothetical protein